MVITWIKPLDAVGCFACNCRRIAQKNQAAQLFEGDSRVNWYEREIPQFFDASYCILYTVLCG